MAGLFLLLALTVVMAVASFLAGALPLSMTLSQSQLRLLSSIGIGMLVGTSLIVIIPEGIEAITEASVTSHSIHTRSLRTQGSDNLAARWIDGASLETRNSHIAGDFDDSEMLDPADIASIFNDGLKPRVENGLDEAPYHVKKAADEPENPSGGESGQDSHSEIEVPSFYVGLALILGFVLMFLVDRVPRIASENFQAPPAPRQISLSNLGGSSLGAVEEESEGFLGSLTPTPKQSRSLATTTGLVIHAAADGIAMGASAASSDTSLGFLVFFAIMIHKAPAAFGLTSVLLKQGLSKRAARGHLIVFCLASPFGAWATYILANLLGGGAESQSNQWWTGMLLLFSGGTFLYVAMHAMQEGEPGAGHEVNSANGYADGNGIAQRKHSQNQVRETLATIAGMFFPLLTLIGHHH